MRTAADLLRDGPAVFTMAPMAGVTDAAFRRRLRRNGCRRMFTEMVSAAALARGNRRTRSYLCVPDGGPDLGIQLFGADGAELAEAALQAQQAGFRHIDLNMGCPVRKVVRSGSGAALLKDLGLAERCLSSLRKAVHGTLSVKIRAGWDLASRNFLEVGRLAEDCGVDWITLHPRTRADGYAGTADWTLVGALAAEVGIPVVGNGDVTDAGDALDRMRAQGCAGVMIGRAAAGRPWIFREAESLLSGEEPPPAPEAAEVGRDLLLQMEDLAGWKGERAAVFEMRKFVGWSARGRPGAAELRRRVQTAESTRALAAEVERFFIDPDGGEVVPPPSREVPGRGCHEWLT